MQKKFLCFQAVFGSVRLHFYTADPFPIADGFIPARSAEYVLFYFS